MSFVDIFYLSLVIVAFSGFAVVLAHFTNSDTRYRAAQAKVVREAPEEEHKQTLPKAA